MRYTKTKTWANGEILRAADIALEHSLTNSGTSDATNFIQDNVDAGLTQIGGDLDSATWTRPNTISTLEILYKSGVAGINTFEAPGGGTTVTRLVGMTRIPTQENCKLSSISWFIEEMAGVNGIDPTDETLELDVAYWSGNTPTFDPANVEPFLDQWFQKKTKSVLSRPIDLWGDSPLFDIPSSLRDASTPNSILIDKTTPVSIADGDLDTGTWIFLFMSYTKISAGAKEQNFFWGRITMNFAIPFVSETP
jgi:hypothetical protein